MSRLISASGLVMSGDSDDSVVVNLKNMKQAAKGYYTLSDTEIITFLSTKKAYIHFDQDKLLYVKDQESEDYITKMKSKNVFIKDHSSLIFNKPNKKNVPVLLESARKHSGENLNATDAYKLSSNIEDMDESILEILKLEKEKVEKEQRRKVQKEGKEKEREKEKLKDQQKQRKPQDSKDSSPKVVETLPRRVEDSETDDDSQKSKNDDDEGDAELGEEEYEGEGEESEEEHEGDKYEKEESEEEEELEKDEEEDEPEEELTDADESGGPDVEIPKIKEPKVGNKAFVERRDHMVTEANRIVVQLNKAISIVQHSNRKIKTKGGDDPDGEASQKPKVKPTIKPKK